MMLARRPTRKHLYRKVCHIEAPDVLEKLSMALIWGRVSSLRTPHRDDLTGLLMAAVVAVSDIG
jgi:hypothetical protein